MQELMDGTAGRGIAVIGRLGSQAFTELPVLTGVNKTPDDLRWCNAELAEAVAARDAFIAVAAHELRNPMTPMIGQVDLLLNGLRAGKFSPEQVEQRLERIQQVMGHYLKRATTLLDVPRITGGKLRLDPAPCDLAELGPCV